jgi:hypothetical protein
MLFDDVADIVEAQPKSFYGLGIPLRNTEKLIEYIFDELRRYAHAVVADLNDAVTVVFCHFNMDLYRSPGVFDGIVYDVMKSRFQVKPVTIYI